MLVFVEKVFICIVFETKEEWNNRSNVTQLVTGIWKGGGKVVQSLYLKKVTYATTTHTLIVTLGEKARGTHI